MRILLTIFSIALSSLMSQAQSTKPVLTAYLNLKEALVAADGQQARKQATGLLQALDRLDQQRFSAMNRRRLMAIDTATFSICKSSNVDGQRRFFKSLSVNMVGLIRSTKPTTVYVQYSPMTGEPQGVYWLSDSKQIANPYLGGMGLRQGKVIEVITTR